VKLTKEVLFIILFFLLATYFFRYSISGAKNDQAAVVTEEVNVYDLESNELLVSFLPISIGESTLIQLANNDFYLIDTGANESSEELITLLQHHAVQKIKGIILTNPFEEHAGALKRVLDSFPVETIYIPKLINSTFHSSISSHIKIVSLQANDVIELYPDVKMMVLAPSEPLSLSPQANSLVFQLNHKEVQFLFTSDINQEIEKRLIQRYDLKSEILKVSDFGSSAGSDPDFIKKVDPQIGIIFSGDPELYRISDDVIERLNESWIDVYMIHRLGEVQIISDGSNYQVKQIKRD